MEEYTPAYSNIEFWESPSQRMVLEEKKFLWGAKGKRALLVENVNWTFGIT